MNRRVAAMLGRCGSSDAVLPATQLFNEGWMLRLVLDWFSRLPKRDHPLTFSPGCRWFSEALLPSQFFPQSRGDGRSESWTHADGVIGHFQIGQESKGGLRLSAGATYFVVCEAKLFSALSPGAKNAPMYDQAARNVACMAEVLRRAKTHPRHLARVGFHVIAPHSQIDTGVFAREMTKASIREKVSARVAQYGSEKDQWLMDWFHPTLEHIELRHGVKSLVG